MVSFNQLRLIIVLIAVTAPLCFCSDHGLMAQLVPPTLLRSSMDGTSKFKFVLSNPSPNPITFLKWNTPMEFDKTASPIFVVKRAVEDTIHVIPYTNRMASRILPANLEEAKSEFITLNSGETIHAEVDISKGYQLDANATYEVTLDAFLNFFEGTFAELVEKTHKHKLLSSVKSNSSSSDIPLSVSPLITESIEIFSIHATKPHLQMAFDRNCNQDLQNRFWTLFTPAVQFTNAATSYLQRANCDALYVTYFGYYQSTNRWNTALYHFQNIQRNLNAQSFSIICDTTCQQYVVAFVYANDRSHQIHLCPWLYQQPLEVQGNTLIHELSHFDDVAGTRDHVYGDGPARQLALTNPDKALNCAENHGTFAMKRPYC